MANNQRELLVAICETRKEGRVFGYLAAWNATGIPLRQMGVRMVNLCEGTRWTAGLITKSIKYREFLKLLLDTSVDTSRTYVILMDSDSIWSVSDPADVFAKFDDVRQGKQIVLSSELNCWIGSQCLQSDVAKWYEPLLKTVPSYSLFVNSGLIMGRVDKLYHMYDYALTHQNEYLSRSGKYFSDQFAITDYARSIAPQEVAIDHFQTLFASSMVVSSQIRGRFICRWPSEAISHGCRDISGSLLSKGYYHLDASTCAVHRLEAAGNVSSFAIETQLLAPRPVAWHFPGKHAVLFTLLYKAYRCMLRGSGADLLPFPSSGVIMR